MRDDSRKKQGFGAGHVAHFHLRAAECSRSKLYSLAVARRRLSVGMCVWCLSRGSCPLWLCSQGSSGAKTDGCVLPPNPSLCSGFMSSSREAVKMSDMAGGILQSYCRLAFGSRLGKYGVSCVLLGADVEGWL